MDRPNIMIVITDQQSGNPHWPEKWANDPENFPAMHRLKSQGVTFKRAYTNSCTCSPSRVTLFTGLYPAQHGVTEVLEFDNITPFNDDSDDGSPVAGGVIKNVKERRQRGFPPGIQNLAKMLKTADYNVVFKGKWHLTKPANWVEQFKQKYWTPTDVDQLAERFGFDGWTMPDAGDNLEIANMGGGSVKNDQRFIDGNGQAAKYGDVPLEQLEPHSAIHFLQNYDSDKPFCLIVSLVNPHDVLAYPDVYKDACYKDCDFDQLPIAVPPTWEEDLSDKPSAQAKFKVLANAGNGVIASRAKARSYCQFYAYLCSHVDKQIKQVLDVLDASPFSDNTMIVRISDHGDMAMAHGLQRQKMFNMYEETLNVPLIISHPSRCKGGEETDSLASLIDLMPTLATIAKVPERHRWEFKGVDLSSILEDPKDEVQDHIHFTYEDLYFYVPAANHMRAIVERNWKYAVYYDIFTNLPFEYEMYQLDVDPDVREVKNLGNPATQVTPQIAEQRERLHRKLIDTMVR